MNKALRGLRNLRKEAQADIDARRAQRGFMESFAKNLDAQSKCRYCGESVEDEPERCPHCDCVYRKIKAPKAQETAAAAKAPTCKYCGEGVEAGSERCPHCGGRLAPRLG